MSDQSVLSNIPTQTEIRADLETMVIGYLLGPTGSESEVLTEWAVQDRCMTEFNENMLGTRFAIGKPPNREVLQRLLKLNHERYAEEVKQGLHDKKKGRGSRGERRGGKKKGEKKSPKEQGPSLFDIGGE